MTRDARRSRRSATTTDGSGRPTGTALVLRRTVLWLGLVALLEVACRAGMVGPQVVPAPTDILAGGVRMLGTTYFWPALGTTLAVTLAGAVIGVISGLLLGVVCATAPWVRAGLWPWVTLIASLPAVAMAPIFVGMLGFGMAARVATAAMICFFPMAINTLTALSDRDRDIDALFTSLGASRWKRMIHFLVPNAAPGTLAGLKTAVSLAFIGAVVAEFVTGDKGIGILIKDFTFQLQIDLVFFLVLVLAAVGLAVYSLVGLLERRVVFWL